MLVIKHILGKLLGAIKYSIFGLKNLVNTLACSKSLKTIYIISGFLVQGLRNLKPIDSNIKKIRPNMDQFPVYRLSIYMS
jgi:hypothetical protein